MRAMLPPSRRVAATLRAALADVLDRLRFMERRRDHWRALYMDLEASLVARASEPGFVAEDEKALVDRITALEGELVEARLSADEYRRRACNAEKAREKSDSDAVAASLELAKVERELENAQCKAAHYGVVVAERDSARDALTKALADLKAARAELDGARTALAEERARRAGVVTAQEQAA